MALICPKHNCDNALCRCIEPDDVRVALSETYKDYAAQALAAGERFEHGLWLKAAEIAREFVVRRRSRCS